ncbi:MAG: NAD(P)H-binding protein [Anaerolineales bacterium]|nr:NAD(P)H-binding protein [Anaerolineales bacterium]
MILITGGTGFIGQVVTRQLVEAGYPVRMLIRPSPDSPSLPKGLPVEVAVSSLTDPRGLRAAMAGVDVVYHLVGTDRLGPEAKLLEVDIQGTLAVAQAAAETGVDRFFTLSHLGADRSSAYPLLKAKGIAEEHVRRSGVDYTIIRTAPAFGPGDTLTTGLAALLYALPFFFLVPGNGQSLLQPIWVEDLATCLVWTLEDDRTRRQTFEVGGPEYLTFQQIVQMIMTKIGVNKRLISVRPPYIRGMTLFLETIFPILPVSVFWIDYLAVNRTCPLDTVPRTFGLLPSRFSTKLDYLTETHWGQVLRYAFLRRKPKKKKS